MRLLLLSQAIDETDWLRAFMVHWAAQLAQRVEHLDIITQELGPADLPDNVTVHSLGKEKGYGPIRMVWELWRLLGRLAPKVDAAFSHMNPRLAWLSAPLLALYRKPLTLWYCHRAVHWELRLATFAARRVVSAVPDSFPLPTPKLRAIGHGIRADFFTPSPDPALPPGPAKIVHAARLMPIKHQATLIRALVQGIDAEVVFLGTVPRGQDETYLDELQALAEELGVSAQIEFLGSVLHDELREWYRRAVVAVNLSPSGLFDKAALEGLCCGTPTICSNNAFGPLMAGHESLLLLPTPDDVDGLAERLQELLAMSPAERKRMGEELREATVAAHDQASQMDRLINVLRDGEP